MVDAITAKQNERRTSRSECEMIESTKLSSHQAGELVAYHRLKRKFLSLKDIEKEDLSELIMCGFRGQDFELVAD